MTCLITGRSLSLPNCFEGVCVSNHASYISSRNTYRGFLFTGGQVREASLRRVTIIGGGEGLDRTGRAIHVVQDSLGREYALSVDSLSRSILEEDAQNLIDLDVSPVLEAGALPSYFCAHSVGRPALYFCVVKPEIKETIDLADARARLAVDPEAYQGTYRTPIRRGYWLPVQVGEAGAGVLQVLEVKGSGWDSLLHMRNGFPMVQAGDVMKRRSQFRKWNHATNRYQPGKAVEVVVGLIAQISEVTR